MNQFPPQPQSIIRNVSNFLTPVANLPPVYRCINDIGGEFAASVVDTGGAPWNSK